MLVRHKCPNCGNQFSAELDYGEEVLHSNISITRNTIERFSWDALAEEIRSGHAYRAISVGDVIAFMLNDGRVASVTAVAENPYHENSMAFCFTNIFDTCKMNNGNTNDGGWSKSKMRRHCAEDILPLLPKELVSVIRPRVITQVIDNVRYDSEDLLWLPSKTEVRGKTDEYKDIDFGDVHFEFFANEKSRVKMLDDETYPWWLRSPYVGYSAYFWLVNYGGNVYTYPASNSNGVCPCFLI